MKCEIQQKELKDKINLHREKSQVRHKVNLYSNTFWMKKIINHSEDKNYKNWMFVSQIHSIYAVHSKKISQTNPKKRSFPLIRNSRTYTIIIFWGRNFEKVLMHQTYGGLDCVSNYEITVVIEREMKAIMFGETCNCVSMFRERTKCRKYSSKWKPNEASKNFKPFIIDW